jgi:hypothetical protein
LEDIGDITDRVTVREEIPAPSAIAVVVQPRAKNEVGGGGEEKSISREWSVRFFKSLMYLRGG